jgi:tetratricopeptide (TPR) repeat protein
MTEIEKAILQHEEFRRLDPGNLTLAMTLADLYEQAGRYEHVVSLCEQCLETRPGYPPARSRIASVRMVQGQFGAAEAMLRELLAEGESAPELHYNLGLALCFQERWKEAEAQLAQAVRAGLGIPKALGWWTRALHHLGRLVDALAVGRQWIRAAAGVEALDARAYMAQLCIDAGELEEGRRLAREVLAQVPGDPRAECALGFADLVMRDKAAATRRFTSAIEKDASDPRAWQGLGLVRLSALELPQAIDALQQAVVHDPKSLSSLNALGWAQLLTGDLAAAESTFDRAVEIDRTFAESHGGLASVRALRGERESAERELRRARKLGAAGFGADFAEAVLLGSAGSAADAQAVIQAALQRQLPGGGSLLEHVQGSGAMPKSRLH